VVVLQESKLQLNMMDEVFSPSRWQGRTY
jgi:hypothetical protein